MICLDRRQFLAAVTGLATSEAGGATESRRHVVAYSMAAAFAVMNKLGDSARQVRQREPSTYYLGGITRPWAVLFDEQETEWVLIGERDPKAPPLTLDDLVVVLRARFLHGPGDPGVTVDPRGGAEDATKQDVRFFAGVENTEFGKVCFEADWLMKKIGMNLESVPVASLRTYFDLAVEEARKSTGGSYIASRFWFMPALNQVKVVNPVVLLEKFHVAIFTEVLAARIGGEPVGNLAAFYHGPSQEFARSFQDNYGKLTESRAVFAKLLGLARLSGLGAGLLRVKPDANLSYWVTDYPVTVVKTPTEVDVLYQSHQDAGLRISGGVRLAAITVNHPKGDPSAFRDLVKTARGGRSIWEFDLEFKDGAPVGVVFAEGPEGSQGIDVPAILSLWSQAQFLYEQRRFEAAVTLLDNIIEQVPEWEEPYNVRGAANASDGNYDRAIEDFDRALKINPQFAPAHLNRGNANVGLARLDIAAGDYSCAIQLAPTMVEAYLNRGIVSGIRGEFEKALSDYDKAISLKPSFAAAWFQRGLLEAGRGNYAEAETNLNRALESDPHLAKAHLEKGSLLEALGRDAEALECYRRFLQYDLPAEDGPRYSKEVVRARAMELAKDLAIGPDYASHHHGVPLAERLRRVRASLGIRGASGEGGGPR